MNIAHLVKRWDVPRNPAQRKEIKQKLAIYRSLPKFLTQKLNPSKYKSLNK